MSNNRKNYEEELLRENQMTLAEQEAAAAQAEENDIQAEDDLAAQEAEANREAHREGHWTFAQQKEVDDAKTKADREALAQKNVNGQYGLFPQVIVQDGYITDGYSVTSVIVHPESDFISGHSVVPYTTPLSANAQILVADKFFQATKGTGREFFVRESNATRLGMTVPELEMAAQELVLSGKAVRNPAHTSRIRHF